MLNGIVFGVFAFAILLGINGMLFSRNVMYGAYWLLEVAVAVAGIVWFMGAEYIAIMQLLIYAGAVGILVIFAIMVTLRSTDDLSRDENPSLVAFLAAACVFGVIAYSILTSPSLAVAPDPSVVPSLAEFGAKLYSANGYALPFEAVSLVLTVALVAAVWWTKTKDGE